MILSTCRALVKLVTYELVNVGKAGRSRWKGIRPTVRGSVMNPNDHHTVVVKVVHLSVDHLQCHHGVNQRLVRKLVVVKIIRQTYRSWT